MIGWADIYQVVAAMTPLYVALLLGYGSVKWWGLFNLNDCNSINRLNCFFIVPFFNFQFTASVDPYNMNFRFLAGDVIAKAMVGVVLALWAYLWENGELSWALTSFSLSSLNNTLIVGVPLLKAMYGAAGEDLTIQSSVIQSLLWFPILLFMMEVWGINNNNKNNNDHHEAQPPQLTSIEIVPVTAATHSTQEIEIVSVPGTTQEDANDTSTPKNFGLITKQVMIKLAKNPNMYACVIGIIWALLAKRWDFEMPSIVEGSIQIMSTAGSGVAMFSMGLFVGLQEKTVACGVKLTIYAMVLRFVVGPITTFVGCVALGMRSRALYIAIVQAALPQAISSFVFAQEYGLHANVLSTAVIIGTIVSLPLLTGYYLAFDAM